MKLYGIYEQVVGVPASSLSQLRGPWPENVEDPWSSGPKPLAGKFPSKHYRGTGLLTGLKGLFS